MYQMCTNTSVERGADAGDVAVHPDSYLGPDCAAGPALMAVDALMTASLQACCAEAARLLQWDGIALLVNGHSWQERERVADMARTLIPRWHFAMLNDTERNDAFNKALEHRVVPGSHVLDIGSGTGLLAMMAVRAGAGHVTTCEANPLLAEIARQIIDHHGMSNRITVVPMLSTDLQVDRHLIRPADLLVTEIVDCGLVGEGLLPSIRHARKHLLTSEASIIPQSAVLHGFLIESDRIRDLNRVADAAGFDVHLMNHVATQGHFPIRLATWPFRQLCEPTQLARFDLLDGQLDDGVSHVDLRASVDATADALVVWFELDLGADVTLCNSPDNIDSHWMQAVVPLAQPLAIRGGRCVELRLRWHREKLYADIANSPIPGGIQ